MKNHPGIQKLNGGLERTLTNKMWREKHASVMLSKLELKVFAYRNGTVRATKKTLTHLFLENLKRIRFLSS